MKKMVNASLDEKRTAPLHHNTSIDDIASRFRLQFSFDRWQLQENSMIGTKNIQYASSKPQKPKELPNFLQSNKELFMKESETFLASSLYGSSDEKRPIADAPPRMVFLKPAKLQKLMSSYVNVAKGGLVAVDDALVHEIRKMLRRKHDSPHDHGSSENPSELAQAVSQTEHQNGFLQGFAPGSTLFSSKDESDVSLKTGEPKNAQGSNAILNLESSLSLSALRMKVANWKESLHWNHKCIGRKKYNNDSESSQDFTYRIETMSIGVQHFEDGINIESFPAMMERSCSLEAPDASLENEQSSPVSVLEGFTQEEEILVDVKDIRSSLKALQIQLELLKFCHWSVDKEHVNLGSDQLAAEIAPLDTSVSVESGQTDYKARTPCSWAGDLDSSPCKSEEYGMQDIDYHRDLVPFAKDDQVSAKISEKVDRLNTSCSRTGPLGHVTMIETYDRLIDGIHCPKDKEEEWRYVKDALVASGFAADSALVLTKWYSQNQPIDPLVYERLEDAHHGRYKDGGHQTGGVLKICSKRLLFDNVNEILVQLLEPYIRHNTWRYLPLAPFGEDLMRAVWLGVDELSCTETGPQDSLNALVSKDLAKTNSWLAFSSEIEEVGLQVERAIFGDLIEDTLLIF